MVIISSKFPGPQQYRCAGTAITMYVNLYNCLNYSGVINFGTIISCRDFYLFNIACLNSSKVSIADPGSGVHTK